MVNTSRLVPFSSTLADSKFESRYISIEYVDQDYSLDHVNHLHRMLRHFHLLFSERAPFSFRMNHPCYCLDIEYSGICLLSMFRGILDLVSQISAMSSVRANMMM